jgi:prenyltransferase beta subunit
MLGCAEMIDQAGLRQYLLEKTQHVVGGFAKAPGEPPGRDAGPFQNDT